jgi:hypothetical protein
MDTFPSLIPSEAPIVPGTWPTTAHKSLNGAESRIRHGSAPIGGRWSPAFVNITEADYLAILSHYRGQRSGFDPFGFSATTLAADRTPAGFAWLYAGPPRVVDQHPDCFTVQCGFRCVPRGLVVVSGKAWRTGATTLTVGTRDGGIVYGPTVAWVTAATTFAPGSRSASSASLLLHMDGSNDSTTFINSGGSGITVTAYGNARISTTDPKYGSGSLLLDGSGDYLQTDASSILQFGTGDFTVECWVKVISGTSNNGLFTFGSPSSGLAVGIYEGQWFLDRGDGNSFRMGAATTGSWQHLAVTRSDGSLRFFIAGTQIGATISTSIDLTGNQLIIGYYYNSSFAINARVDEFRVEKGTAFYTSTFTPPTGPFPDT